MNTLTRLLRARYGAIRFRIMDLAFLVYTGLIGVLILVFHGNFRRSPAYALLHAAMIVASLEIIRAGEVHPERRLLRALRILYSLPLMLFLWTEMDAVVPILFNSYWATTLAIAADKALFGVHPSVWIQQFRNPALNEAMAFFYTAYFAFFIAIPLFFFLKKKYEETFAVLSLVNLTYYANYFLFLLVPALSPSHAPALAGLHTAPTAGYFFVRLNAAMQSSGGVHGAAFPSSHVAGALVWVLAAARYGGKKAYALVIIVAGISLATVYMGYHHAVDPLSGCIWGALCFGAALRWMKRRGEDPRGNLRPGNRPS